METKSSSKTIIPTGIEWQPAWITWVGATTTCLNSLGVDCDKTDVAGYSGYAFVMTIHEQLCASGPTVFEWGSLLTGIGYLGRSTVDFQSYECHTGDFICDRTKEHCKQAFKLVKSEINAGRPCVIWGAYMPEFAVVYGIEDCRYIVKSYRETLGQEQPPVKFDEINAPGGPYMLGFPSPTKGEVVTMRDKNLIKHGVRKLTTNLHWSKYAYGLDAYNWWIRALEKNRADGFGNSYNAQCFAECKHYAKNFIQRIADRNKIVRKPLEKVVEHYEDVVSAMDNTAKLFPFPEVDSVNDENNRKEAIKYLKQAQLAETSAVEAMQEALRMDWE